MKIIITSMYANPLHPGHVDCLELAKDLCEGDGELWVIINNDHQARLKRGTESFQDENFRMRIVGALKPVDKIFLSIDKDESVCKSLEELILEAKKQSNVDEVIFAKGGDRFATEIPERSILDNYGVRIVDGLGPKTHHSSDYIKEKVVSKTFETITN